MERVTELDPGRSPYVARIVRKLFAVVLVSLAFASCSRTDRPDIRPSAEPRPVAEPVRSDTPAASTQTALLAGGCFWGMEELLRQQYGVVDTTVGYTGGSIDDPGYREVSSGKSGHAESLLVEFDPKQTSYEKILLYFFTIHDPTTKNRQGNDVGTQYRSAIFVKNAEQRRIAERIKNHVAATGEFNGPITTEIVDARAFHAAEDYHQDYLQKNPGGYTCHYERDVSL